MYTLSLRDYFWFSNVKNEEKCGKSFHFSYKWNVCRPLLRHLSTHFFIDNFIGSMVWFFLRYSVITYWGWEKKHENRIMILIMKLSTNFFFNFPFYLFDIWVVSVWFQFNHYAEIDLARVWMWVCEKEIC